MKEKIKNLFSFLFRLSLSAFILWFVLKDQNLPLMWETVKQADVKYLFVALTVLFFSNVAVMFRWGIFLKSLGMDVAPKNVFIYYFCGLFGNLFLPSAIGGDMVKAYGLCREKPAEKPKVFASILLDRLFGFIGISLVATVGYLFAKGMVSDVRVILAIGVVISIALILIGILFTEKIYKFFCLIFKPFPRIEKAVMQMHYDAVLMKGKNSEIILTIVLSCIAQILLGLSYYFVATALGVSAGWIFFVIFSPIVCVVSMLPSIGGLGVRELGWSFFLSFAGVSQELATNVSLTHFAFIILLGLAGGVIYVTKLPSRRVQHHQTAPEVGGS